MKRSIFLILSLLLLLTACQPNPEREAVVSKNDGAFDANVVQSAGTSAQQEESQESERAFQDISVADSFLSTDSSVQFTIALQEKLSTKPMPVVEVAPHFLTGEDAERTAQALFPGGEFWEAQPSFATVYSKSEILDKLNRWAGFTSDAALEDLFGYPQSNGGSVVRQFLDEYNLLLETAPETVERTPCRWEFQESWKYSYTPEQVAAENISISTISEICASTTWEGTPYQCSFSTRNESDYLLNQIYAGPYFGSSPLNIDNRYYIARLCRTPEPNADQLANIQEKATQILEAIALGDWTVDQCFVQKRTGGTMEYSICVQAVPRFYGADAVRRPQLSNLKSKNAYSSNYYLTDASFEFSPDGTLLDFKMFSPVDVVSLVNDNPAVLEIDALLELAKGHFQRSDAYAYGFAAILEQMDVAYTCQATVSDIAYGLSRTKVPGVDNHYYYVPSLVLYGDVEYRDTETGEVYFSEENRTFLILNAVDGSVIPLSNE